MAEERKLVSILFADIVDSTPLGRSEDPELVRRTLGRVFAEMRDLLTTHGGTVEKFIGDAVMAVFGVPVSHDDDAERAVRAAFALRERIATLAPTFPFPVSLRIGINSGQVVSGSEGAETLVTGAPVNAAARIQQNALPGEIAVGELTRSLTAMAVRYDASRKIEGKGIGAIDIHPALALESAIPTQHRGLGQLRAPLIGRDAELRLLVESHRKATEERGACLVTVYGQAGVGKSRLIAEFVEVIGRERVLRGRCLPYGTGITYWPLQEMLRADTRVAADDGRDEALRKLRAAVLAAFGAGNDDANPVAQRIAVVAGLERAEDALPGTSGSELGQELRWGVRRYFEERAKDAPLTLVVDDIHWAEDPMLEMIEHLTEWSRSPLFILCMTRPELRDRRPSWGGGLMNASSVRLEALTAEETRRLIAALLDIDDLPEVLREQITERAQGNPLYVEEMLRMLIDTGHIERHEGRWVATTTIGTVTVPASLQGLLAARLDQLSAEAKRVLQRAAVIGKVFYPQAIASIGPTENVGEHLLTAARRDFVVERDERGPGGGRAWQFKHILIRDVAYESLAKEERSRLHDAFGRWLEAVAGERRDEYAEIVAYHADHAYAFAAELRDPGAAALGERALALLMTAARRARRTDERRASYTLHARARDVAVAIGARIELRVETAAFAALAHAQIDGEIAARDELAGALALAREAGPSESLVELLHRLVRLDVPDAEALATEAIAAARASDDHDLVVLALLEVRWPAWYRGDLARCARMISDARAYAVAHDARRHFAPILVWQAIVASRTGDFATLVDGERERVAAVAAHESKIVRTLGPLQARTFLGDVSGDFEDMYEAAAGWLRLVPDLGLPGTGAYQRMGRALLGLGRFQEAVESYRESLRRDEARGTATAFVGEARQQLARAQLGARRIDEARASAERAYREIADDDAFSRSTTAVALALVRHTDGDTGEAERLFRIAIETPKGYRDLEVKARVEYARFLLAQRRAAEARAQLEIARDFYAHPFVARRRAEVEALLKRCDEVRAS